MKKMYKKIVMIICFVLLVSACSIILSACGPSEFTVTFNHNYAECPSDITTSVESGKSVNTRSPQDRTGYTFKGWFIESLCTTEYDFAKPVDKDLTLYAKWEINNYTITWDQNYTGKPANKTTTIVHGSKMTEPAVPTRTGYIFGFWHTAVSTTDNNKYNFDTFVTTNITLYASWTAAESYTITLNTNGGSAIAPIIKDSETPLALSELSTTLAGYVVKEWCLNDATGAVITFPYTVTGNITLFAVWIEEPTEEVVPVFNGRFAYGGQVDNTYVLTLKAGGIAELTTNGGALETGTWTYNSATDIYTVTCGAGLKGENSTKSGENYILSLSLFSGATKTNLTYTP